ncbi:MAG: hypothetical protein KME49_19505 [Brasilonema octagenarum HA4186-MV1]|nr:hypothetical protein [Brasilonema octagenarum]MBW4627626.1 hypothetical protein [Brasilonema octagenarum HA4186-MV1]
MFHINKKIKPKNSVQDGMLASQHEWDLDITYLEQFGISSHSSSPRRGNRAGN